MKDIMCGDVQYRACLFSNLQWHGNRRPPEPRETSKRIDRLLPVCPLILKPNNFRSPDTRSWMKETAL